MRVEGGRAGGRARGRARGRQRYLRGKVAPRRELVSIDDLASLIAQRLLLIINYVPRDNISRKRLEG